MYVHEFDTELCVQGIISIIAERAADIFEESDERTEEALWRAIQETSEDHVIFARDAIAVICTYGLFDALEGGVDYEDSPISRLEADAYPRAVEILEERGLAIEVEPTSLEREVRDVADGMAVGGDAPAVDLDR